MVKEYRKVLKVLTLGRYKVNGRQTTDDSPKIKGKRQKTVDGLTLKELTDWKKGILWYE